MEIVFSLRKILHCFSTDPRCEVRVCTSWQEKAPSPFDFFPQEIVHKIFYYLSADLGRAAQVCKSWQENANAIIAIKDKEAMSQYASGADLWAKHYGEVKEPPTPRGIFWKLGCDCPAWKGKKVHETHILFLIPETVNEKPLSLDELDNLAQNPKKGPSTKYNHYNSAAQTRHGKTAVSKAHWVLATKDVLPDSRGETYDAHKRRVNALGRESKLSKAIAWAAEYFPGKIGNAQKRRVNALGREYELLEPIEAVAGHLLWYVSHDGKKLLGESPPTSTRCQKLGQDKWALVVGDYGTNSLAVTYRVFDDNDLGVVAAQKFYGIGT